MSQATTPNASAQVPATTAGATGAEPVWAKPAVSIYGMTVYLIAMGIAYAAKDSTALTLMLGASVTMGTQVVNYWLGSSSGSDKKTGLLAAAPPVPPPAA